jgi:hypothetical protein
LILCKYFEYAKLSITMPKDEKFRNTINKRFGAFKFIPNLMKNGSTIFVGPRYERGYDNIAVPFL